MQNDCLVLIAADTERLHIKVRAWAAHAPGPTTNLPNSLSVWRRWGPRLSLF